MEKTIKYNAIKESAIDQAEASLKRLPQEKFGDQAALGNLRRAWTNSQVSFSFEVIRTGVPCTPTVGTIVVTDTEVTLSMGFFSPAGSDTTLDVTQRREEVVQKFVDFFSDKKAEGQCGI